MLDKILCFFGFHDPAEPTREGFIVDGEMGWLTSMRCRRCGRMLSGRVKYV